ncbi:hypothetical protein F3Y22_tig00110514pilonHSYRG00033 [Hibiscus syriacus]|uniref:Uncharacterized protein n=1 Tax=Hibiscus syriacus TaxID=106335 RepID=A0A6A3ACP5_HIBSY|nr:hypothetical protein F3Y22_tig00110514pilonHSYRG00033 [Hibiscus syriacus]
MQHVDSDNYSSDYEAIFQNDFTDIDSSSDTKEILNYDSDEENKLKKQRKLEKKFLNEDDYAVHLLNPMIGFRVLTEPDQITQRTLPEDAIGLPYFYFENVALAPVGVWTEMSWICKVPEAYDDEPPSNVQKYVLDECRKWNLAWVGRNKVVPLEPDEVEMLLVMQRLPFTVLAYP